MPDGGHQRVLRACGPSRTGRQLAALNRGHLGGHKHGRSRQLLNKWRDVLGHAGLPPTDTIVNPQLGQIESPRDGETRRPRGDREAHRHPTIILLPELTAVLASDADGMASLLGEPRVIDDPRRDFALPRHGRQDPLPDMAQQIVVVPRGFGDDMMKRLMHPAHVRRREAGPSARRSSARRATAGPWRMISGARSDRRDRPWRRPLRDRRQNVRLAYEDS